MTLRTKEIICISVLLSVTVFFCLFHIKESPPVWYDEGIYTQAALNLGSSGVAGFVVAPGEIVTVPQLSVGYPLLYPLALVFKLLGAGVLQARLLMVLFILGLVAALFVTIRITYGSSPAIFGASLLALFPPLYGTGKSVLGEVPGTFFFVLALVFLGHVIISLPDRRKILRVIGAGLCAGFAIVTKPVFILILPALVIAGLVTWRRWVHSWRLVLIGISALVLPILVWLFTQFTQSGSLTELFLFYSNPSQVSDISMTILANLKNFITDSGPMILAVILIIWIVAFIIRIRKNISIPAVEIISFTFCVISVAAFLRTAGYYRYLLPYQVIALAFFPQALVIVANAVRRKLLPAYEKIGTRAVQIILVLMMIVGTYQLLFSSWVADSYGSDRTAFWENYFSGGSVHRPVFYYDVPEVTLFDHTGNYYQYINMAPAAGISVGLGKIPVLEKGIPASVIIETQVMKELPPSLFARYQPIEEIEKYTILGRLSL